MYDIVVVGSINMDFIVKCHEFPQSGDSTFCQSIHTEAGGKGNNQAVSAASYGKKVCFIGCIGEDEFGKQLRQNLQQYAIEETYLVVKKNVTTGSCVGLLDDKGTNTLLVNRGANFALTADDINRSLHHIDAKILLIQMETSQESILAAMQTARQKGMFVILDPAPVEGINSECFPYADLIIPNSEETKRITGITVEDEKSAIAAAAIIHQMGIKQVIIKMGGNGCLFSKPGYTNYMPALKVNAVNTIGAGDCFAGALASYLIDHPDDIENAIQFAQIAAGLKVSRHGGHSAIPTMDEVQQFLIGIAS